ncbi:putative l-ascorbate oxidase protein [Lasiodiplodia theobromae]|nr:putative l-ascorbate oxidase protein [Lasiodiplodia theobromae]
MLRSILPSLLLAAAAWAKEPSLQVHDDTFIPDAVLRVTEGPTSIGCIQRDSVVVNGTVPGPQLSFVSGSVVWIRVYNDMPNENLTMHWHGLTMATAPFSDGSPAASQWAIAPLKFFDYEINLADIKPGTYFYHSHVGFQAITATGSLIITDKPGESPPYEYDDERDLVFTDLYNTTDHDMEGGLGANPFKWTGEVGGVLINGHGISSYTSTNDDDSCSLARISVDPGKTYRLRLIGATALSFFTMAIEDHNLTIIEADGAYTEPVDVSFVQVGNGQRYSALLKTWTCDQLAGNAARGRHQFYLQLETRDRPSSLTTYAVLDYGWLDDELHPLTPRPDFPTADEVTRTVVMDIYQLNNGGRIQWTQNDISWYEETPRVPYLVALYTNSSQWLPDYETAVASGTGRDARVAAWPAKMGEVLEIVIQNTGSYSGGVDSHPMHFHGAHYFYLGSGPGTYDRAANEARLAGRTPVTRDTTMLYRYSEKEEPKKDHSWVAWRIRVEQPGVWMLHCHILQHMIMGMQTAWVFGNSSDILTLPLPMVEGYLVYGGNVLGDDDNPPSVVHFFDNDNEN